MKKLIIFGTGSTAEKVKRLLSEEVKIIAYADNDREKWNKVLDKNKIISPNDINNYNYDYIIIASQFNSAIYQQLLELGIDKRKILQYYIFSDLYNNFFDVSVQNFKIRESVELIATGISYTVSGINQQVLNKSIHNFAYGSQDIYYGYKIVKKLIDMNNHIEKEIKYCIIGLCYYSFQYDLTLSSLKDKAVIYYQFLKDHHNHQNIERIFELYKSNVIIADDVFRKKSDGRYDFIWTGNEKTLGYIKNKEQLGYNQAKIDCNKNYPETVLENKEILIKYLELLKNNNIKPIIVVFPASKYYTQYFSKKIECEFKNIINELEQEFSFQYIDYFRSKEFNDDDFQDVSHLGFNGAKKFTKILNEKIIW